MANTDCTFTQPALASLHASAQRHPAPAGKLAGNPERDPRPSLQHLASQEAAAAARDLEQRDGTPPDRLARADLATERQARLGAAFGAPVECGHHQQPQRLA